MYSCLITVLAGNLSSSWTSVASLASGNCETVATQFVDDPSWWAGSILSNVIAQDDLEIN